MTVSLSVRPVTERALEVFRRAGNPFRNYFARNPDDEVCRRYHVPELYANERRQLLSLVDLFRYGGSTHSDVVPVLGNKGSGKTHLLHSIKHGAEGGWQLVVTPGTFQKDTDFLEYLLFQIIDTLLGGGKQRGNRPLESIGEPLARGLLRRAIDSLRPADRLELFGGTGISRWARRWGIGASPAQTRLNWLAEQLADAPAEPSQRLSVKRLCAEAGIVPDHAVRIINEYAEKSGAHDTIGNMRRKLDQGLARAVILGDESNLAGFLTFGFADMDFQVRPGRQELVLSLFKVITQCFLEFRAPIIVAFDQLEDLLLARRADDGHKTAEAFFAGIVQVMHQVDGICFLVFAERGLWNRFIPSLDGYIQDRLNNPIHLPQHGTIKTVRLEAPTPELVRRIVEARLRPTREELPDFGELSGIFPFNEEQVQRIARAEPTLRDMLQQFRQLFDRLVYDTPPPLLTENGMAERITLPEMPFSVKSVIVVETSAQSGKNGQEIRLSDPANESTVEAKVLYPLESGILDAVMADAANPRPSIGELWEQEFDSARHQLAPEGALIGATRELQSGLGKFLEFCHRQGLKVGPWRITHVVEEMTFGDHPTYGAMSMAHWVCKDSQPWKVGIGLFLSRGAGKPRDLEVKLAALDAEPRLLDYLILLRPGDDLIISGKSKTLWQASERRGRHARIEPLGVDEFACLYAFPRWLAVVHDSQSKGDAAPALADFVVDRCERLLQQLCMPIHD